MTATTSAIHTAGKRTRDRLYCQLRALTRRDVAEVRITPALYGDGTVYCAMAIGCNRREIPLPGVAREVAALIRAAFPDADWRRAQDYDVTTGTLTEHIVRLPAGLQDGD